MDNDRSLGTIHCANLTHNTPPSDQSPRLDNICLVFYWLWLITTLCVVSIESCRRKLKFISNSVHIWIIRIPFLFGTLPSLFAILSAWLKPSQTESYIQSQATRDFIKVCSNPLTQEFNSSTAIQTLLAECSAVQNRMNADIGGIGIRISLYISLAVTVLSSLTGHFHQEKTAVKDIGTAQLACKFLGSSGSDLRSHTFLAMLSTTFALLRSYTVLSFWQIMVAVMSLDITSATVQMALSQKDTLASRWWVVLNSISQLLVQTSLGIVLGKAFPFSPAKQDPCQPCVRAVWWGAFDSCDKVPFAFWIYWTLRTVLLMRSCAIGLRHMHFYDFGDRIARGEKSSQEVSRSSHLLRLLTFTNPIDDATMVDPDSPMKKEAWRLEAFPSMPATTLTDWILWMLPALVALLSLERMLTLFDLSKPGNIEDWGQTTTFMAVVCGLVARAVYLFYAKLKRRSCLERTKAAGKLRKPNTAQTQNLSAEDFASFTSKRKSFRDIRLVLQPLDRVRVQPPEEVWYDYVDPAEAKREFLQSAVLNDTNGLIEWAKHIPDLSEAVDDKKKTALHLALEKNNTEAIETIMGLMDPKLEPGDSSTILCMNLKTLLNASDDKWRTPWEMIMPAKYDQVDKETLGAVLRFRYPVRDSHKYASSSQIINMIFIDSYPLEVVKAWIGAAKQTHSLRQLEDSIIRAVETVPYTLTDGIVVWTEAMWEFCCLQLNDTDRTTFGIRLLKALLHRSGPYRSGPYYMSTHVASRFAQFLKQKRAWTMEFYPDIAQIVASYGDSLDDNRLIFEQRPQNLRIGEQVLIGAASNWRIGQSIIKMMLQEWPEHVDITPKVLEACLTHKHGEIGPQSLAIFLTERPHHIQVTESILMFAARSYYSGIENWEVLIEKYRSQIKMTQKIFDTMVDTMAATSEPYHHQRVTELFRKLLTGWPRETKITNKTLLSLMRKIPPIHIEVIQGLHELRREEIRTAIDSQVVLRLKYSEDDNPGTRDLANFFCTKYPEECKDLIRHRVLEYIGNSGFAGMEMNTSSSTSEYVEVFRQGWPDKYRGLFEPGCVASG
jgi:hypothetical protein